VWANTVLASGSAIGVVIYVGRDTRAMCNASVTRTKIGRFEHELNVLSKLLFVALFVFALTLTLLRGLRGDWWLYLFRYMLLLSYIIPISLRVNCDMAKLVYAYLMEHDDRIHGCVVRSSDFPEELGRIGYLLSDKTGTLSQNCMQFRKLHLGSMMFSRDTLNEIQSFIGNAFSKRSNHQRHVAVDALIAIAVTHNVTPVIDDDGNRNLQAASPDEVALVSFAESVGLFLFQRTSTSITIQVQSKSQSDEIQPAFTPQQKRQLNQNHITLQFEILMEFPFTSESKRMGIIVRDKISNKITFYVKGADSVMQKMVQFNDWLEEETMNFAREGLRTLVYGKRELSEQEYNTFVMRMKQAKSQIYKRNEAVIDVQLTIERDLNVVALTGVEDQLQVNVRSTLEKLRHAGIKTWMLTGDKVETATCVALSARLIERGQHMFELVALKSDFEVETKLEALRNAVGVSVQQQLVLIVDGISLELILKSKELSAKFIELAAHAPAAIACRCSPLQKSALVELLQEHSKHSVAAIGDGGNDVGMIQQANVGIGIPGKEGKQASLAADFSISTFSHLAPLLLWHGRNSYKRSARLALFVMHRGLIIAVIQIVYSSIFYYAALSVYHSWILVGYATVFTMFPIFSLVLDEDVSEFIADTYPELYRELQKSRSLNLRQFVTMTFKSVYQGLVIMVCSVYALWDDVYFSVMNLQAVSFSALVLTELLMIALEIHKWKYSMVCAEVLSMLCYFVAVLSLPSVFERAIVFSWQFIARVVLVTLLSCLPVTIGKFMKRKLNPPSYSKLTT